MKRYLSCFAAVSRAQPRGWQPAQILPQVEPPWHPWSFQSPALPPTTVQPQSKPWFSFSTYLVLLKLDVDLLVITTATCAATRLCSGKFGDEHFLAGLAAKPADKSARSQEYRQWRGPHTDAEILEKWLFATVSHIQYNDLRLGVIFLIRLEILHPLRNDGRLLTVGLVYKTNKDQFAALNGLHTPSHARAYKRRAEFLFIECLGEPLGNAPHGATASTNGIGGADPPYASTILFSAGSVIWIETTSALSAILAIAG